MAHQEQGHKVLENVKEALNDLALVEAAPKKEGRHLFMILAPDPAKVKEYKKTVPMKRFGKGEEVAAAVLFLASKDASYITGASLEVTAGL